MSVIEQLDNLTRCDWCLSDELYIKYHDVEWGVPLYDERDLFEFLILEGMQAGLSWITILRKRENYRQAFANFDPITIAGYSDEQLAAQLTNPGIIRNRLKVAAIRGNAQAYVALKEQGLNFSEYLWQFVDGKPQQNHWRSLAEVPASTEASDRMARDLKKRGFRFVGSTICYAFMQATGMINDHLVSCFRHKALSN